MANPTPLGSITGVGGGVGTKRALEAMWCVVELYGGQGAGVRRQALSRHCCVSLGASLTSQGLSFVMRDTYNVVLY